MNGVRDGRVTGYDVDMYVNVDLTMDMDINLDVNADCRFFHEHCPSSSTTISGIKITFYHEPAPSLLM